MPIYNYQCSECRHAFDELHRIDDRRKPCEEACPECKAEDSISIQIGAPKIVSGTKTPLRMAGQEWKDVLSKVKSGTGKGHTIND